MVNDGFTGWVELTRHLEDDHWFEDGSLDTWDTDGLRRLHAEKHRTGADHTHES